MSEHRRAIVEVNFEALGEWLFGKGTTILGARQSFNAYGANCIAFAIESDKLDPISEGFMLPTKIVIVHEHKDGDYIRREIEFK